MATLATESWTGTNGAAWPAQWTTVNSDAGATHTVQSNRGRATTPAAAYGTALAYLSGMSAVTDTDVTVTLFPTSTAFYWAMVRVCGTGIGSSTWTPTSGYQLWLTPNGSVVNAELKRYSGGTETTIVAAANTTTPWSTTNGVTVRLQRVGSVIRFKTWAGNGTEPGTWTGTYTDASPVATAGKVALATVSDADALAKSNDWDNLTVTDGASAPAFSANVNVSGSGTLTASVLPGVNAPLSGSGTLSASVTPRKTLSVSVSGSGTLSATSTNLGAPWQHWNNAKAARATTPATVLAIGDSWTEGQGVTARANRWIEKVAGLVRAGLPTTGAPGGVGYLPSFYGTYAPTSTDWTPWTSRTGTHTQQDWTGTLGARADQMSAGASTTYTVTGTAVDVWWLRGGGTLAVSVDGGAATNINTAGATGFTGTTRISLGASGSHTVAITATTASTLGGITVYDGDDTKGLRFLEAAHTGAFTDTFLGSNQMWAAANPDLVLICVLYNDMGDRTPAQTKSNLLSLISELRANITKPFSIAFVLPSGDWTNSPDVPTYADHLAKVQEIIDADSSLTMVPLPVVTGSQISSDGVHPSDSGHLLYAQTIAPYLIGQVSSSAALSGSGTLTVTAIPRLTTSVDLTGAGALTASLTLPGRDVFRTPTQDVPFQMEGRLYGLLPYGLAVWRINGVWHQGFTPSADEVAASDRFYGGGRLHSITPAEKADLIAGGYADYISLEAT